MELNEDELKNVLGGANPAVIHEQLEKNNALDELSEDELANALGGARAEVLVDKAMENPNVFRERRLADIQREKEALMRQREEVLAQREELNQGGKAM